MPLKMRLSLENGWKEKDNERFGNVLVLNFINTDNNQIMFKYAPKLEDKVFFEKMFRLLFEYDGILKQIRSES